MNDLTLVNLFFVITGTAVIIITVMLAIGLVYLIMFLRTIKRVAETAQRASEQVVDDIQDLRENIREKGFSLGAISDFAKNISKKRTYNKKEK